MPTTRTQKKERKHGSKAERFSLRPFTVDQVLSIMGNADVAAVKEAEKELIPPREGKGRRERN